MRKEQLQYIVNTHLHLDPKRPKVKIVKLILDFDEADELSKQLEELS